MKNKASVKRTTLTVLVVALAALFLAGGLAQAKTFRLSMGTVYPKSSMIVTNLMEDFLGNEIEKRVAEQTEHEVKFTYAWAGTVAKHGEILEAVQKGILDMGMITTPFEPAKLFLHSFGYYVPFSSGDIVQVAKITLQLYDQFPIMTQVFEEQYGQKFLAIGTMDGYQLITKNPWDKVEDLKGRKIGGAGPNLAWIEAVGAVPVQSKLSEMYTSAQTGVFEGILMINDPTLGYKLYEPCPYLAMADFGANPNTLITINLKKFNKLPPEIQEIIVQVAREYTVKVAEDNKANREQVVKDLEAAGAIVKWMSFEDRAYWANLMPNIPNERAKEADERGLPGSEFLKAFLDALEADGYKFPRKWVIE